MRPGRPVVSPGRKRFPRSEERRVGDVSSLLGVGALVPSWMIREPVTVTSLTWAPEDASWAAGGFAWAKAVPEIGRASCRGCVLPVGGRRVGPVLDDPGAGHRDLAHLGARGCVLGGRWFRLGESGSRDRKSVV